MSEEMEYVLRNVIEQKEKEIKDLRERLDFEKYTACQMNALGEALKVKLRHHKYKRCLAMVQEWRSYAAFCGIQSSWHNNRGFGKTAEKWTLKEIHAWRCVKRWLKIAEKFKEAK